MNNSKDFGQNIYVKKIGSVSKDYLNITSQNEEICNLRVDEITEKFNNSIPSSF